MAIPGHKAAVSDSLSTISTVLLISFVVGVLHFGRGVLVPVALAALLAFLLSPLVTKLQRRLGRVPSVICVVMVVLASSIAAIGMLTQQTVELIEKLPSYKENIHAKLDTVRKSAELAAARFSRTFEELKGEVPGAPQPADQAGRDPGNGDAKPVPVEVVGGGGGDKLKLAQSVLGYVFGSIGTAALVFLLLIFMLLQREEMRNRMIRLLGKGHLSETTQALDDAGSRVSRYLLMQLIINVTYGIPAAIGLYFIGVPNAMLWGSLTIVLRFIPYVGPWIGASFPILMSLATSAGWTVPLLTVALFVTLELISNNLMEPLLYGSSTGLSPLAVVIAAIFWTSLWGPIGLVLATPLTVCLVVMGRHVPRLSFLSVMLSDEQALSPAEDFYQRLLSSGDHDEMDLVTQYVRTHTLGSLYDEVFVQVLAAAGRDHRMGLLDDMQVHAMEQRIHDILSELEERTDAKRIKDAKAPPPQPALRVCCVPARSYRDYLGGAMLGQLLREKGYDAQVPPAGITVAELPDWIHQAGPDVVCVSAVPPTSGHYARSLCWRLRLKSAQLKLVVGLWGRHDLAPEGETIKVLHEAGANEVLVSMCHAVEWLARERNRRA